MSSASKAKRRLNAIVATDRNRLDKRRLTPYNLQTLVFLVMTEHLMKEAQPSFLYKFVTQQPPVSTGKLIKFKQFVPMSTNDWNSTRENSND